MQSREEQGAKLKTYKPDKKVTQNGKQQTYLCCTQGLSLPTDVYCEQEHGSDDTDNKAISQRDRSIARRDLISNIKNNKTNSLHVLWKQLTTDFLLIQCQINSI